MFRWLTVVGVLCVGTFFLMDLALGERGLGLTRGWFFSKAQPPEEDSPASPVTLSSGYDPKEEIKNPNHNNSLPQLVFHECRIQVEHKADVPSEADGVVLVIGVPLEKKDAEGVSKEVQQRLFQEGKWIKVQIGQLFVEESSPGQESLVRFPDTPEKTYRLGRKGERLTPGQVRLGLVDVIFRKLEVGEKVEKGQTLGLVDPKLALDELEVKVAKFEAADAERLAAEKTRDEAKKRYEAILATNRKVPGAVSPDEMRAAELTWQRYVQEEVAKRAALRQADRELNAAHTQLRMHEVKAGIAGVVKLIFKNRGDAVKKLDPLLQIQNPDQLRVEGMVEKQETAGLEEGMTVSVEPTRPEQPKVILRGHTGEVHCVAVAKDSRVVSGSEDRSLRVWDSANGQELWTVEGVSPVRSVTCTGPHAEDRNLILAGFSDGVAKIYNLDNMKAGSVALGQVNQGAVTSVAFSADGKLCLTAGDDRSIQVWKVDMKDGHPTVERLYRLPSAHPAVVTHVQFIPTQESGKVEFLSVGRDNTLLVWAMEGDKGPVKKIELDQRSGDVPVLGTDGKRVLFDQGNELRMRSLADRTRIEGRLRNQPGSANFSTMALFSPDGKTILTNCSNDNRLQLWRTPPMQGGRGSELRQLVWATGAINCGAFAPQTRFLVTGTQDQCVLVWKLPEQKEIDHRLKGKIIYIEKGLEGGTRQVRLWAELELKDPESLKWIIPGGTATMVYTPSETEK